MKILDDAPLDAATRAFAVELKIDVEKDGNQVWELRETASYKDYGVPTAMVPCRDGRTGTAALRTLVERFNEPPEDCWEWTAPLLSELCGIALAGWHYPPNYGVCPHGNVYSPDGSEARWLGSECAPRIATGQPGLFRAEDAPDQRR